MLGDGRTVALLATDGSVDWWALPALDSPPVLSGLLDPDGGGRFTLAPSEDYEVTRRYLDDTNVIETVYTAATGVARVTAALERGFGRSAALDRTRPTSRSPQRVRRPELGIHSPGTGSAEPARGWSTATARRWPAARTRPSG